MRERWGAELSTENCRDELLGQARSKRSPEVLRATCSWEAKGVGLRDEGREYGSQTTSCMTASQRLGLIVLDRLAPNTFGSDNGPDYPGGSGLVPGPEFYTMEWTSNGPRSNLESGLVPGGRSSSKIWLMNRANCPPACRSISVPLAICPS